MKGGNLFICIITLLSLFLDVHAYTTTGNKIYDPNGNSILLRGVDRPSLEWSVTGQDLSLQDYQCMRQWGSNVVRVALNQDSWLSATGGAAYQAVVAQQVTWIRSTGMGVIFDLHWNKGGQQNMADLNSITFWTQFANVYKNNSWVIFELYNEPHDISWTVWQNGDGVNYAGMQQLYNAVRGTGATNMVIVNGLNYAFDLSQVLNYPITGTNIAYGSHPYDYSGKQAGDWQNAFGYLAPTHAVILTEFGQYCNNNTYVSDLLKYATTNYVHWTAWAWFVSGCGFPSIITDWNGTPDSRVGAIVLGYLGGNSSCSKSSSGGSGTPVSGSGSNSGSVTPASSPLVVYTDSLQGWTDWSWSTSYSLSSTAYVYQGSYSIKLEVSSYQAVYFHTDNLFQIGAYESIQFYANGGTVNYAANSVVFLLYDSTQTKIGSYPVSVAIPANKWTSVSLAVSGFGLATTTQISGIALQASGNDDLGAIYFDQISLTPAPAQSNSGGTGSSPSSPSSTTGTGDSALKSADAPPSAAVIMPVLLISAALALF